MTSCTAKPLVRPGAGRRALALGGALLLSCAACTPDADRVAYPGANRTPSSQPGWQKFQTAPDPHAPADEAHGGFTARGTPLIPRDGKSFPAESRNLFFPVDQVATRDGKLAPLDYTDGGEVTPNGRDAIRGQNTWMLWTGGNEAFFDWLHGNNYGLVDFLILLDSRKRGTRFTDAGLINRPGMRSQTDAKVLGLYLDVADGDRIMLQPPAGHGDTGRRYAPDCASRLPVKAAAPRDGEDRRRLEKAVDALCKLPTDGVDPAVYGYPSGVVGLRLMPNPDFFAGTKAAARARKLWEERVEQSKDDAYYGDPALRADPRLVRPFRVGMSCAFCHIAPHPLNPPRDKEAPEWENLSSTIGNQYWRPEKIMSNLLADDNFIHHFLASQRPGTLDTSLVSPDHINNANTINPLFDLRARLARAARNATELQGPANLLSPSLEEHGAQVDRRHTPRYLLDGADSIGTFGALSRVYLNIGLFGSEWVRLQNLIIGFKAQRPFSVATLQARSGYWRETERRAPYLAAFFTYRNETTGQTVTAPMKLAHTPQGRARLDAERDLAAGGRDVFLRHCAICHSSKQPDGFELRFSRNWTQETSEGAKLVLPYDFGDWELFTRSAAYAGYVELLLDEVRRAGPQAFFEDNYLSTDVRIPVTLVGTNSGRAMATNAMRGQVWDNFSSETYKRLPSVGAVRFYNPYSGAPVDEWGNNDAYDAPAGGPGYYRPPPLIGLWATAPYLHNNTLGRFAPDPSVEARLAAFDDGMDKLLWRHKRTDGLDRRHFAERDPGLIHRTTRESWIAFPAASIRPLLEGVLGSRSLSIAWWAGIALVVTLGLLALGGRPRHAGLVLVILAALLGIALVVGRLDRLSVWLWALPALALAGAVWFWLERGRRRAARVVLGSLCILSLAGVLAAGMFVDGRLTDLRVGPIPRGTPVNLIMNVNPDAPPDAIVDALAGLARGVLRAGRTGLTERERLAAFEAETAAPLLRASKCPDFVLDRGHWFAEGLSDEEKRRLKAFLLTL